VTTITLGDLADFVLDGTHGSPSRSAAGVPVLSAQNVEGGRLNYITDRYTTSAEYEQFSKRLTLRSGDLLLTIVGTIGRAAVVTDVRPAVLQRSLAVIRPHESLVDSRFLYYATQSPLFKEQLRRATNASSQAGVYLGRLKEIEVALPSLSEQRRISDILHRADALRVQRRRAIESLSELTQSIFFHMFGDPISNPNKYRQCPLIELVDHARPITYGILKPGPDQEVGVKYVRVVDMVDGGIRLENVRRTTKTISDEYRRSILSSGDLLISIRGHVGRLAVVPEQLDGANITQDTARLAVKGAAPIFVRECLRSASCQHWMARHTKGAAVKGINLGDLKLLPIIMPPQGEQEGFSQRAVHIESMLAHLRIHLSQLDTLFSSLQCRAFAGEL
jgi:type I restriction enzyme, S subunit